MDDNERRVVREAWNVVEQLQLNRGPGKPFDTVKTGRMQKHTPRVGGPEPCDIDSQIFAARTLYIQRQRLDSASGA